MSRFDNREFDGPQQRGDLNRREMCQAAIGTHSPLSLRFIYSVTTAPLSQSSSYQGGLSRHRLQEALAYIQDHLAEDISLSAIAQEVDMSQHYFCRLFKQSTGYIALSICNSTTARTGKAVTLTEPTEYCRSGTRGRI